jgi:hypothetical protein
MNIMRHRHATKHPIASDGLKALPLWQDELEHAFQLLWMKKASPSAWHHLGALVDGQDE